MSDIKPELFFNKAGIYNACRSHKKNTIDWSQRKKNFFKIIKENKKNNSYDILVPVSGGIRFNLSSNKNIRTRIKTSLCMFLTIATKLV